MDKKENMIRLLSSGIADIDADTIEVLLSNCTLVLLNRKKFEARDAGDAIIKALEKIRSSAERCEIKLSIVEETALGVDLESISFGIRILLFQSNFCSCIEVGISAILYYGELVRFELFETTVKCPKHEITTKNERIFKSEDKIIFVESKRNNVYWHCDDDVYVTSDPLYKAGRLLSERFMRVGNAYFVNMDFVERMQWHALHVRDGEIARIINIPEKRYGEVSGRMEEWCSKVPDY